MLCPGRPRVKPMVASPGAMSASAENSNSERSGLLGSQQLRQARSYAPDPAAHQEDKGRSNHQNELTVG